jgi:hypothetical protein
LGLLKDKPITGKSKVIELLEQQTNNKITDAMWTSIYNLSKSKINVEKNGPGNQNIYSLKLELKSE